ncbi:hypothetical protein [Sphingomonas aracearum]|uniref:Lectin-like protein BA14k n=1 Tax=Sphingomonas aracearum TaxID=2283317 RepID=A0A369VTV4_9SPHN|nr:hypothetical protein [Sphingomonas aracearum]RDE05798.1 hypothetical protein DVW87_11420 [Sphingomonas aracearum]
MNSMVKKAVLGLALGATALTAAAPAEAQRYRGYRGGWHHRGGDAAGAAILGGIVGLGVGAAIASSNRDRYYDGYYDRGYYPPPPPRRGGYYARDYYYDRYPACYTQRRFDPYYGRSVRVRVCN